MNGADDFAEFAGATQQSLYRHAYLLTGDQEAARDLVQTTLLKLYRVWRRVRGTEYPRAYAHTTLVRAFLENRRRWRREQGLRRMVPLPSPEDQPDLKLTVLNALAALPPKARAVVVLRYWQDLSVSQVAETLGCSEGTVKSQASRALNQLRKRLGETFHILIQE